MSNTFEKIFYCELKGGKEDVESSVELFECLGLQFSTTTEIKKGTTTYTFYADSKEQAIGISHILKKSITDWKSIGLEISQPKIRSIKKEDWNEVWKKHFKIQKISPRLIIKASWLNYTPKHNEIVIEIDPEMSFGTGSHETTQFCLKMIEKLSTTKNQSFLDAGCGSGILSIAAIKFGFYPVYAFDYDNESILTTEKNLEKNGIKNQAVNLEVTDINQYKPGKQFDIIAANIISLVLIANKERLISWLSPRGRLILSGILKNEYSNVKNAFLATKLLTEIYSETEKDWTGGIFEKC